MKAGAFATLLKQLKQLTPFQKEKLESTLHRNTAMDIVSDAIKHAESCPHCGIHKNTAFRCCP